MTRDLTSNEKELVRRMTLGRDEAEWGFDLLLKHRAGDLDSFFDPLMQAGLFDPRQNMGPIPFEDKGLVQIPFWPVLRYLKAVATRAGERSDRDLAKKVMGVIRDVSKYRDPDGTFRDNEHTFRIFAEILGVVPLEVVTPDDIELIPQWLSSRFDHGLVAAALDEGFMRRALASSSREDWDKACRILDHCTEIKWVLDRGSNDPERREPVSVVEDYWLEELIKHHVEALGTKVGRQAADIFVRRLREVFDPDKALRSYLARATVEDSDQNTSREHPGDPLAGGLRDVLQSWVDEDADSAREYVRGILRGGIEIVRRIAIHILSYRWSKLQDLYLPAVSVGLFTDAHLHELYQLLQSHFGEFTNEQKAKTLAAIRGIPPGEGENSALWLRRAQRRWLSAIANQGYEPADRWYLELEADPAIGKLSINPSHHFYCESWSGYGPSPFTVPEIIQHAREGTLIEFLHGFKETDGYQGPETPSTRALVDALSEAVKQDPNSFIRILPEFLRARRPYQYGVINGFKSLWDDAVKSAELQVDWDCAWGAMMDFFAAILSDRNFWEEEAVEDQNNTPNRDWIPPLIASFLKAGTQTDTRSYPEKYLPIGWRLIESLLDHLEPEPEVGDEPMTFAINSSKGKAIEALVIHALRVCRVEDRASHQHLDKWESMTPAFERELGKCRNGNYEMSTLCGAYVANLDYLRNL